MRRNLLSGVLASAIAAAPAANAAPPRAELPIREVVLSDGARRYAVDVAVAGKRLQAGLDTGSTGLRILQRAAPPHAGASGRRAQPYSFGSGVQLEGVLETADLAMGDRSGRATFERVDKVGCAGGRPRCPAARLSEEDYRLQGDGQPGEGFPALLGINMASNPVGNPLIALGVRRWIVELPRPGDSAGQLVLDPLDAEAEGYVFVPLLAGSAGWTGALHDAVAGCLTHADTSAGICGALLMDTGAPGISVRNAVPHPALVDGASAALLFNEEHGRALAREELTIGSRAHASRLTIGGEGPIPSPVIYAGLAPYFAFSVLYDPEHRRIGLKPREPSAAGPVGRLIPR